jgi:diguanylate cyclase (GGDEF)-like protein/PAS domain S-box-containing protein
MRPTAAEFNPHAAQRDSVRILLLEDDAISAGMVRAYLGSVGWAESQLEWVDTLDRALSRLAAGGIDMVIADLNLPDSSGGLATLDALKRATDRVVVVLSGDSSPGVREAALARGAYDFLHKEHLSAQSLERLVRLAAMQAQAFRSLRDSEERFRSLTELSSDWYWEQDRNFRFTFMAGRNERLGVATNQHIGKTRWELPALNFTEADWVRHRAQLERHEPFRDVEVQRMGKDGRSTWAAISGVPIFDAAGEFCGYRGVGSDITARKLEELELRRFRAAMDTLADGVMVVDRETLRYIDVNNTACEMQGFTREELLALGPADLAVYSRTDLERDYDSMIASGETTRAESFQRRKDGSRFAVEILRRAVRLGERWVIVACVRDITGRRESEARIQRLGRMYAALSALNEAIPRAKTREELFARACEIAASSGGFLFAAIRQVDPQTLWAPVVASAGSDFARFSGYPVSIDPSRPEGRGLIGTACRSGQPIVAGDFFTDPRTAPWHGFAHEAEFRSVGVFPLYQAGQCAGALLLHGTEKTAFEGEMYGLLERMAQNISFGLDRLQDEAGRLAAEAALLQSSERFRSLTDLSADLYWEQDTEFRFTVISGRSPVGLKGGRDRMMGKHRWDQRYFNMDDAAWAAHKATLAERRPFRDLEMGRLDEAGGQVWVSVSGEPVFDSRGAFTGYRGVGKDITARKREERLLRLEHTVTKFLAGAETVSAALRDVLRGVCEAEGYDNGRYFELDAAGEVMRLRETWSSDHPGSKRFNEASRGLEFKPGVGLVGTVWRSKEPLWVEDVLSDERVAHGGLAREMGMHSAGVFPVGFEGRIIAVLSVSSLKARKPDERLLRTMEVIASQLGQYLMRKRAEEDMRRFRLAMENSADMIVLIDRATMRFVDVNDTVCKLLGYTRKEMLAMGPEQVLPVSRDELAKSYDDVIADPSTISGMKSYYRCKDGSKLRFESTRRALRSGDRWIIAAISRDVRERDAAEQAVRESEARFRALTELSSDWYWEQDAELRFTKFEGRRHAGDRYDPAANVLGKRPWEIAGIDAIALDWQAHRTRMMRHESFRDFEYSYRDRAGTRYFVSVTGEPVHDAEGRFVGYRGTSRDVTQQRRGEDELRRFRVGLDASADMVFLVDPRDSALLDFNETACRYLGYAREELLGLPATAIRVDPKADSLMEQYKDLVSGEERFDVTFATYQRKDGATFPVELRRQVVETADGPMLVVNARDLTEQRRAEERQSTHLRHQEKIALFGQEALAKRDAAELIEGAVQAVLEGLRADAVAYLEPGPVSGELVLRALVGSADTHTHGGVGLAPANPVLQVLAQGEPVVTDGATLPFDWARKLRSAAIVPVRANQGVRGALCAFLAHKDAFGVDELNFVDAAASVLSAGLQRSDSEGKLAFLAQFDALTGLPNRALLADRFSQVIVQARRHKKPLGVLFIDLDDFKLVNDTLGHAAGDELLKETARRLQAAVRPGDTVARISGDEFAVVLNDLAKQEDAAQVAQKVIDRLGAPMALRGQEVFVTASIGIAAFPGDGDDAEALLGAADAAMYRAKQSGRNAYHFFTAEINQRTRARAQLGSELHRALEREEFVLAYQPKIDLRTGLACAAEALLRWKHPERGIVSPAQFVPVLEETGMIVAAGEWVLEQACRDIKSWQDASLAAVPIAINLSARQFRQQDLDARIRQIVESAGVAAAMIELEITESQLMQDPDHAIRVMRALSESGIRIAIDDFGTGYSSLAYLTRFPVSSLKIDRSFVADLLSDKAHAAIARAIVDMAHTLGFIVVAEGVETEGQAAFLRGLGCEQAQGYLFHRPMPEADFRALLGGGAAKPEPTAPPSRAAPRVARRSRGPNG